MTLRVLRYYHLSVLDQSDMGQNLSTPLCAEGRVRLNIPPGLESTHTGVGMSQSGGTS